MISTTRRYAQSATRATAPEGARTKRHPAGLAAASDARPLPPSLDPLLGRLGRRTVTLHMPARLRSVIQRDPRSYLALLHGDCLRPKLHDGDRALISPASPLVRGAMVALHFRDGRPSMLKQLICPPMPGMLSATGQVSGNVRGAVLVEMLNPCQVLRIDLSALAAIHAVVGVLRPEECGLSPSAPAARRAAA